MPFYDYSLSLDPEEGLKRERSLIVGLVIQEPGSTYPTIDILQSCTSGVSKFVRELMAVNRDGEIGLHKWGLTSTVARTEMLRQLGL